MKKLFMMFLVAFMFVAPATADDTGGGFTLDTRVVLSYDNFANTGFFSGDKQGLLCFMYYLKYLDYLYYDYYDESKNGFRMSMSQLYGMASYIFKRVLADNIPDAIMKVEYADVSCPVLHDMLKDNSNSVEQISSDFVWDTFSDAANMQRNQLLAEIADNQQKAEEAAEQSGRMDANMNGNPDDIYNITVQYTDNADASYARMNMFSYIRMYIIGRYCATETAYIGCVPTPYLNCDLLPNTTYLQRDLDLLCNNRNWEDYVIGDGVYELRLKRQ